MKFKSLLFIFFPVIILIGLTITLNQLAFFSIKKISCQIDQYPCSLAFEPTLVNFYQQNIFKLKSAKATQILLAFDPNLTDIQVTKKLPNQISITAKRRQPMAQLVPYLNLEFTGLDSSASATLSGVITNQVFQLDQSGEFFMTKQYQPNLYPTVAVPESFNFDQNPSLATKNLSDLIKSLQEHYVSFNLLAWLNQSVGIVKTNQGPYAIIDLTGSLNSQVASLQYILSGYKIGESLPVKIDLRFDKPVLTF
ncbi:MAG: hypothetical protein V1810_02650 [Candidatus Beckwithbacteria bacterium]